MSDIRVLIYRLKLEKEEVIKAKGELSKAVDRFKAQIKSVNREKVALKEWAKRLKIAQLRIMKQAGDKQVDRNIKELIRYAE